MRFFPVAPLVGFLVLSGHLAAQEPKTDQPATGSAPSAEQLAWFERTIRPLLSAQCYECHSVNAKRLEGGLHLDSRVGLLNGGDSGPSVTPGKPDESLLIDAIRYESFEMPPRGKLKPEEIAALTRWVREGAFWPNEPPPQPRDNTAPEKFDWRERKATHWAWQPLRSPQPPEVAGTDPSADPIDRFIRHRLHEAGLKPSDPADRATLIRRVTFDLIGLPPTPEQVRDFVNDKDPAAYERLVDRLLASDHFGEKWARHWMDLVRYAESHGHEFDYDIPHVTRYRDYLIRAFNDDLPYDRFVREHVAGDLLPEPRVHPETGVNESVIATGFWYLGEATHSPTDVRGDEALRIDNQIDVFSRSFLGLSVACARCHDHKFDPIPATDYYALAGFLQSTRRDFAALDPGGHNRATLERMRETTRRGNAAMEESPPWRQLDGDGFRKLLLAASALRSEPVVESETEPDRLARIAAAHGVTPERLTALRTIVEATDLKQPHRPLAALAVLKSDPNGWPASTRTVRNAIRSRIPQPNAPPRHRVFEDFSEGLPAGWSVTGFGIDENAVTAPEVKLTGDRLRLVRPGTVSSDRYGAKTAAVLRSPTFTIDFDRIDLIMRGENTTVKLIIDGYHLQHRNGLLFGGTALRANQTKTDGEFRTLRLGNSKYRGHRAWLEFHDDGPGGFEIDEIHFLDGNPIAFEPHPFSASLLETAPESPAEFATRFATQWDAIRSRLDTGTVTDADVLLINRLLGAGLLTEPPTLAPIREEANKLADQFRPPLRVLAATDGTGEDERLFIRGSHQNLGPTVPRRFLIAIAGEEQPTLDPAAGSGRLELADRMLDKSNPLPARVLVNRLWHHLFGRGLVPSVDDFGAMGQPPSHPDLLDHLAVDFRENNWKIKRMIRRMVLSDTYRQSSRIEPDDTTAIEIDPTVKLLWRMPVRRLTAEQIRDGLLAVSGRLDRTVLGPSVPVHLTPYMQGRGRPGRSGPLDSNGRRSLYIAIRRNFLPRFLMNFDYPVPFSARGRRSVSNVPAQALVMLNNPLVRGQAEVWARRMIGEQSDPAARLETMFLAAFARAPSDTERERLMNYAEEANHSEAAWIDIAHVLLNRKEFLFLR